MCGLLGGIGLGMNRVSDATLGAALACIRHRGPDAEGLWRSANIALGHRRLSIIDLDARADQPMRRGSLIVVFNGEIYNFRELRRRLEARGHRFVTTSDTEVLLAGWQEYGASFLEQIEGMFAFALFDESDGSLTLLRDRFGEKPLFVLTQSDRVLFASELSAVERLAETPLDEDSEAIGLYFRFSYVPAPYAPLRGVRQLEPGTLIVIRSDLTQRTQRYYEIPRDATASIGYRDAVASLREHLDRSVKERLMAADVPVATLLSGGIDSSIVTVLASRAYDRPLRAYSLTFPDDPNFDEGPYACSVARMHKRIEHQLVPARVEDLLGFTDRVFSTLSEPLADASLIPTAYLLSHVKEKVVLGGDGADEVFGGYGVYPAMVTSAHLPRIAKRALRMLPRIANPTAIANPRLRAAALFHANMDIDPLSEYLNWRTYATPETLALIGVDAIGTRCLSQQLDAAGSGRLTDIQAVDISFNLPNDMLRKVDIASMMFGIEARLPYLDSDLVRFALSLPDDFRVKGSTRKRILRDAFAADLPHEILHRRKMGFLMPIRSWFRGGPLRDSLEARLRMQNRFEYDRIHALITEHAAGTRDHSVLLWSLFVYLSWQKGRAANFASAA